MMPLKNTLVDGELVIDVDLNTKRVCLRLLMSYRKWTSPLGNHALPRFRLPGY